MHGRETPPPASHLREMLFLAARARRPTRWRWRMRKAAQSADNPEWREAARYLDETPAPAFPIKGADLIARGVAPGRQFGDGA